MFERIECQSPNLAALVSNPNHHGRFCSSRICFVAVSLSVIIVKIKYNLTVWILYTLTRSEQETLTTSVGKARPASAVRLEGEGLLAS